MSSTPKNMFLCLQPKNMFLCSYVFKTKNMFLCSYVFKTKKPCSYVNEAK